MKSTDELIHEVRAERNPMWDAKLARRKKAHARMKEIFDRLNHSSIRTTYGAHVDHENNGIDIVVRRTSEVVCHVRHDPDQELGDIAVEVEPTEHSAVTDLYDDPELAVKRVIGLLLDRLDGHH